MSLDRSWQFVGSNSSLPYRMYDALRRRVNARLVAFLLRQATPGATLRVLEPGCGTGFAVSLMCRRQEVRLAVALDCDESALREARKRDGSLHAVVGDLRRLPFANERFDLVYNSSTIEHLDRPSAAVEEMQRVCADHGRVFVGVPYLLGPLAMQRIIRTTRLGHWLGPVFTRRSLGALLCNARLEPLASVTYFWRFFLGMTAKKKPTSPLVSAL